MSNRAVLESAPDTMVPSRIARTPESTSVESPSAVHSGRDAFVGSGVVKCSPREQFWCEEERHVKPSPPRAHTLEAETKLETHAHQGRVGNPAHPPRFLSVGEEAVAIFPEVGPGRRHMPHKTRSTSAPQSPLVHSEVSK